MSSQLASRMRGGDTLARLGGDEFGVLLEGCDLLQAQRIGAQLLNVIRGFRVAWEGRVFSLGAKWGGSRASDEYLELLRRMRDERGTVVPPKAFIPAAERYHLMGSIDRWVVRRALGCLARMAQQARGPRPRVSVSCPA